MCISRLTLLTAIGIFVFEFSGFPVHATSEVLVPSDDTSPGLPSSQGDATPSLPSLDPDSSPVTPETNQFTPVPQLGVGTGPQAPTFSNPTQIIQLPAPPAESTAADASLANNLKIELDEKSSFGDADIAVIQNTLGISPDKIPQHCHLSIGGTLQTDPIGIYTFDTGAGMHTLVRYNGRPTDLTIHADALCDMVPLPPNAGYVMQKGDKYSVFLHQTVCLRPPTKIQSVFFQYVSNADTKCVYK